MSSFSNSQLYSKQLRKTNNANLIDYVQIDGLVILKIIKHCQEEALNAEVRGVLLGLIMDRRLEVTNCFPFPRHSEENDIDEMDYQCLMIRHLRNVNVDHLQVGWYQNNPYGSYISTWETVDSQYLYQTTIEESIVLLYDPARTQKGFLSLKAYRLSNLAMKLCKEGEFTIETLKANQMSFDKFFQEIPIEIKNSHLVNALLCEFDESMPVDEGKQFLDMGTLSVLEKSLQPLMKCVEDVSKWANYQRHVIIKKQQLMKDNALRVAKGEPPMTEEEMNKFIKPPTALQRLETLLNYCQTLNYCQLTSTFASQNIGKLFMAKALQDSPNKSSTKH